MTVCGGPMNRERGDGEMIYKVSYVVLGEHPGTIRNENRYPVVGDVIQIGDDSFKILEVLELVPARGDFGYLHVTCQPVEDSSRP
jgi:hypothetical protein